MDEDLRIPYSSGVFCVSPAICLDAADCLNKSVQPTRSYVRPNSLKDWAVSESKLPSILGQPEYNPGRHAEIVLHVGVGVGKFGTEPICLKGPDCEVP